MSPDPAQTVTREWLAAAVAAALPHDHGLVRLGRFNPGAGRGGPVKAFFGARCRCATAAVLSVEASASKTQAEVESALPVLVEKLLAQRDAFFRMPCSSHQRLRSQLSADSTTRS